MRWEADSISDWLPGVNWNPFDTMTNGITDMVRLALTVIILFVLALFLLSGKANAMLPPPWSLLIGIVCLIAAGYLVYQGGF